MAIYMISYDLNEPGQNYDDLIQRIQGLGAWAHALKSAWFVETSMPAKEIFDYLYEAVDETDDLLITELKGLWWGKLDREVLDWLKQRLP
ncbi:MAG: SinR family protein [Firmicutes bacterium]|nr:SinR family protein [Bacillota bacterium]